jgi:hydrogenase expression/formation protein HypD
VKFVEEYRDPQTAKMLLDEIARITTRSWVIMEICGGQTHSIVKNGLDQLLPDLIELVHGPGCPVCVTPLELIDKAIAIALTPGTIFVSFGDMLRVPGSHKDLFMAKSEGADVRIVYSPLDALKIAREHPDKKVVFFAVGFETTAPGNAMLVAQAERERIGNFSLLVSHVLVPPAMSALLNSPQNRVQAYLAAGHVCTVMGYHEYEPLAKQFKVPIVVTGFEPNDILAGVLAAVKQLESGSAEVENMYPRVVTREGNLPAQEQIHRVFEVTDRAWRGIGIIPDSGFKLRPEYAKYDAEHVFAIGDIRAVESPDCISGLILQGLKKPHQCSQFGTRCTPQTPLGATMVSSEGACAAYYSVRKYRPVG